VQRTTEQITSDLWPLSSEADAVIRRELVRGIATGSNPRTTASPDHEAAPRAASTAASPGR
jgi:hypothetical protein